MKTRNTVRYLSDYGMWQADWYVGSDPMEGEDWVTEEFDTWKEAYEFAMGGPTGMGIVV